MVLIRAMTWSSAAMCRYPVAVSAYTKSISPKGPGGIETAALPSDRTLPPRGPWLTSGLYCPSGSSLTMTSSEILGSSAPTYRFADRSNLGRRDHPFKHGSLMVLTKRAAWAFRFGECGRRFGPQHPLGARVSVLCRERIVRPQILQSKFPNRLIFDCHQYLDASRPIYMPNFPNPGIWFNMFKNKNNLRQNSRANRS